MNTKTLEQLADEYEAAILIIDEQIKECRQDILSARKNCNFPAALSLSRKLTVLYDQRAELKETCDYLRTYYSSEVRCAG